MAVIKQESEINSHLFRIYNSVLAPCFFVDMWVKIGSLFIYTEFRGSLIKQQLLCLRVLAVSCNRCIEETKLSLEEIDKVFVAARERIRHGFES